MHVKKSGENDDHVADTCAECTDGHEHKIVYTKGCIESQEFPHGLNMYAIDKQTVTLLPKLPTKEKFFAVRPRDMDNMLGRREGSTHST